MGRLLQFRIVMLIALGWLTLTPALPAAEPTWTPKVVKRGEDRERTNATDILYRPYRPLHFYGNTVRRMHYRGNPLPNIEDLRKTVDNIGDR